jgi:glycosyltransferase involved in cell wall biosynthesis
MGDIVKYREMFLDQAKDSDVVINVGAQIAFTDVIFRELNKINAIKILYFHGMAHFSLPSIPKVDYLDLMSWFLNITRWRSYYYFMQKKLKAYDLTIHLHDKDPTYRFAKKNNSDAIVLENASNIIFDESKNSTEEGYVSVSNYMHDKNQEFVLRAFYMSSSIKPLIFVGSSDTNYLKRLKKLNQDLALKYGPKSVEFIINEDRKVTEQRLINSFAILFGSKSEKYPVVISEAMTLGKPYISSSVGIVPYLKGGLIVYNEKQMAQKINDLEKSNSLYLNLSMTGKRYATENLNLNKNLKNLLLKIENKAHD